MPSYAPQYESELLPFVERPSRYIDHEVNSLRHDWDAARLRVALVFPDAYEIGISHLGLKILYEVLNAIPGVIAERCYAPWVDAEAVLRAKQIPLCSLESCRPLGEFHIVGFSLQYELCCTNVLAVLDLAAIPLRAAQRWGRPGPLVIAGGNTWSPGPFEPFIDAFALGDGEETVRRIALWAMEHSDAIRLLTPCEETLRDLALSVPGIYVPELYTTRDADDPARRICPAAPRHAAVPFPVRKEIVADLAAAPAVRAPIVPFCEAIHDRAQVEIMRGCVRGCRFCQAGMITRPVREKPEAVVVREVQEAIASSGYEDVTLSSLSAGDCSCIGSVLRILLDPVNIGMARTAVSLPSLRVDSFDPALAETIRRVRKTGFTFAPEAGSDRLRRVINKDITRDGILDTVRAVFNAGWTVVKVYFMIGLPTEADEDIDALCSLVDDIVRAARGVRKSAGVNLSVATFVPKAFTPFQWAAFADEQDIRDKQQHILRTVPRQVKVSFHRHELSRLEAVLARGDRKLADVVERAFRLGCRFDDWGERLDYAKWQQAFADAGIAMEDYCAAIPELAPLPWDMLDCGVTKEFLLDEWHRALRAEPTPSCRAGACVNCGVRKQFRCC